MDWIRRNWPDLLIGIALLLVIAGIIATLLSGGSILPFAGNNTNPTTTPSTSTAVPNTATNTATDLTGSTNAATDALNSTVNQAGNAVTGAVTEGTNAVAGAVTEGVNAVAEGTETVIAPVIPDLPAVADTEADNTTTSTTDTTTTDATTTSTTTAEASTATTTQTTTPAASASSSSTAPYRVGVGAYGNADNAERRAQTFRDAGYPVFLGQQGNLSLVLVGPYNTAAEAEAVQSQIRSSGLEPGATVYQFNPDSDSGAASTPATSSTPTPAATTPAATSTPATPAASASTTVPATATSGRYLQVGAYNSVESSLPQRQLLEGFGFTVVHIEESNFIKLLVGPYDSTNLGIAQSQLNAQGIESFVR